MSVILHVRDFPTNLYRRLESEAHQQNVSISTRLTRILADAYAEPYAETGRYYHTRREDLVSLRLPDPLHHKLKLEAAQEKTSMRALVLGLLARRYGIGDSDGPVETRTED